jgi:TPR repeat protein
MKMNKKLPTLITLLLLSISAIAGDFEDGKEAYEREDYVAAISFFTKSAEQGNAYAQYSLGQMFRQGKGVSQDYKQAMSWYQKAAEQGFVYAQVNLGMMYNQGLGVTQDFAQAVFWFQKAAEQGFTQAQYNLGMMYYKGEGVRKDYVEAYKWHSIAYASGEKLPKDVRDSIIEVMTPSEIDSARKLAREWMEKHKQ